MAGGEQDAQRLDAMEKRAAVVELRRQGLTFRAIGEQMGFTHQRAQTLYRQALAAVIEPAVEAHRAELLGELAEARRIVREVMAGEHPFVQQGRVVHEIIGRDDDNKPIYGPPLMDVGPKLDAARTMATLHAREAKLIGADAPQRIEADVNTRVDPESIELRRVLLEQQARNDATRATLAEGSEDVT